MTTTRKTRQKTVNTSAEKKLQPEFPEIFSHSKIFIQNLRPTQSRVTTILMATFFALQFSSLLVTLANFGWTPEGAQWIPGTFAQLGAPCDATTRCFPETECNPRTNICDCAHSPNGLFLRTFQDSDCRLLPGSKCVPSVDQFNYRCVHNALCTLIRKGVDPSTCPADAACDTGDAICICQKGQDCLNHVVEASPINPC